MMRRELGTFETAAVLSHEYAPFTVVAVLELEPAPAPGRLEQALSTLQRRHPLLGVHIVPEGGRYFFESDGTPAISLKLEERSGDGHWRELAERELNSRIDTASGPLVRCTYLEPWLFLTFHHSVMDGVSGTRLLGQLLGLLNGTEPESGPVGEVLPPADTLLPPAFRGLRGGLKLAGFVARQVGDEVSYRLRRRGCRRAPIETTTRCRLLTARLPRGETSALVQGARRRRVTLNSALCAAMLLAVQRRLYDGQALPMRHMTFANLRPYLDPPVSDRELGGLISFLRYSIQMPSGGEFWELAGRLTGQVEAGLRRGDKFCAALMTERVMRASLGQGKERMATVALSYGGAVRFGPGRLSEPDNGSRSDSELVRVRALHAFVSNFGIGPEYTAQARVFDGELLLDTVYLESDMDEALAREIADDVLGTLGAAGERSRH